MLADREQRRLGVCHHHAHQPVAGAEFDAPHAAGVAAHRPCIRFGKPDRHALGRGEDQFVARLCDHCVDEFVAVAKFDGNQALRPPAAVLLQGRLLHHAAAGGEHQELIGVLEPAHRAAVGHLLARLELEQVDQGPTLRIPGEFGQLEHPHREHLPERGEHEQPVVGAGHEQVLDRILLVGAGPGEPLPAAPLGPVGVGRRPLDVAGAADRDHHRGLRDQFGHVANVTRFAADLGSSLVAVLGFNVNEFLANQPLDGRLARQDSTELADLRQQFAMLAAEFLLLEVH